MTHELKCWPTYYQPVVDGDKAFEVRFDDRGYAVGDTLVLREWEPSDGDYTGRETRADVTYVLKGYGGIREGFAVLGIAVRP